MVRIDLAAIDDQARSRLLTGLVTPRPIAWVVTCNEDGSCNAAPFSFFNMMCSSPPILAIGMQPRNNGTSKDTHRNIERTGEFLVNLVDEDTVAAMNITAYAFPAGEDELRHARLATISSTSIAPPRIAESPVAFECRLRTIIPFERGRIMILGDVLIAHVRDGILSSAQEGRIRTSGAGTVARMHGGGWYARTTDLFQIDRPPSRDISAPGQGAK